VRVNRADALPLLLARLPPGWRRSRAASVERLFSVVVGESTRPGITRLNLLYEDHLRLARTRSLEELLETLESRARFYVAEHARRRVFVHAGVVGWRGRAIVLPGRSMAGKSSLVAELVRAGATYYSDEFAVLDSRGRAHPFAKPISLRAEGETRQEHFAVESLGGTAGRRALPVGLVVVTEYRRGARFRPRRLTQGQGALALLSHAVAARREPARTLDALRPVVASAPVLRGARGEAREAAREILEALARA
jgi:serine kinase of HPr protein (carbohydrate metabolism regulator)